jgi:hypothetical protein
MIYWLIFIILLWFISSYLYHTSDFVPPPKSEAELRAKLTKRMEEDFKRMYPKEYKAFIDSQVKPKPEPESFYTKDRTPELWDLIINKSHMFISAEAKRNYLNSTEWQELRNKRMLIAGGTCECCGLTHQLQCHHVTYLRLTAEHIDDVRILCGGSNGCHQKIHNKLGYDRTTEYSISTIKDEI